MAKENKHGLMVPDILVSGEKIEPMERVDLFTLMVTSMMDFGQMIRQMAMEFTSM